MDTSPGLRTVSGTEPRYDILDVPPLDLLGVVQLDPSSAPVTDEPPHALDYATPATPTRPFRLRSRYVAYATGAFAVFAAVFIPNTVGSGVARVNPFAALA